MVILNEIWHLVFLISHVSFIVAAVGAVTVNDYLHLMGLRNKVREKKLLFVYPILGKAIIYFLILIFITGAVLVFNKPELLSSDIFKLKLALFGIIVLNGFLLHSYVAPHLKKCVLKGGKINCSREVLLVSAFSGSISLASWYGSLVIAFTKDFGYTVQQFLTFYTVATVLFFLIAVYAETRARKWEEIV